VLASSRYIDGLRTNLASFIRIVKTFKKNEVSWRGLW
jgi:hypothetical protein